jgi:hypothetical protein
VATRLLPFARWYHISIRKAKATFCNNNFTKIYCTRKVQQATVLFLIYQKFFLSALSSHIIVSISISGDTSFFEGKTPCP